MQLTTALIAQLLSLAAAQPTPPLFVADYQSPRAELVVTHEGRGYAIDRLDGRIKFEAPLRADEEAIGFVDGWLILRGEAVVRGVGPGGKSWTRNSRQVRAPNVVGDKLLLRQAPGEIAVIAPTTGELLWRAPMDGDAAGFVSRPGGLVLHAGENFQSVDPASGKIFWVAKMSCDGRVAFAKSHGDFLSVFCDREVLQVDFLTGKVLGRRSLDLESLTGVGGGDRASVFAQQSPNGGSGLRLLKPDGELRHGPVCYGSWVSGAFADGESLVARCDTGTGHHLDRDCLLVGLRAAPELSVVWFSKANECGRVLPGSGGAVVLRRPGTLQSVDAATGEVQWTRKF